MDVMLDIETGGTRPGSVIYSIGAVVFDTFYDESNWPTFYSPINRQSCLGYGMTEDPDTILWWDEQSEEAREVIRQANDPASLGIRVVLKNH